MDDLEPGDLVDIVDLDGRRSRYLLTAATPPVSGMVTYELLPDPDNDEEPPASHEG